MITFQHQLQQLEPGIVWLDSSNTIMAFNAIAAEVFRANVDEIIGENLLQIHPEESRPKVEWLLESASGQGESSPPMTMMINIPDRVLLIKVSKMLRGDAGVGTCMVFFDLTDITTMPTAEGDGVDVPRLLFKLPVYKHNKVLLVNLKDVTHLKADGHYTSVYTRNEEYLCNLSLSDLESRLSTQEFVRVHRSHVINMNYAKYFEKDNSHCTLIMDTADNVAIPISRSKVKELKTILGLD